MKKIGLVVPSSNSQTENYWRARLNARDNIYVSRVFLEDVTQENEEIMVNEHLPQACRDLRSLSLDAIAFACTSGSLVEVKDYNSVYDMIIEESGVPRAFLAASAIDAQFSVRGWKRVGLLTPYTDSVSKIVQKGLLGPGRDVTQLGNVGLDSLEAIGKVPGSQFCEWALSTTRPEDLREIDGVFVSCNNLDASALVEAGLRGLEVVSSNSCLMDLVTSELEMDGYTG